MRSAARQLVSSVFSRSALAAKVASIGPLVLSLGCGPGGALGELAREHSPLVDVARDGDRLWLMVRASGLTLRCSRLETRNGLCSEDATDLVDLLQANGVPDVRREHVESSAFWSWMRERGIAFDSCREQQRRSGEASALPCDPYDRLRVQGPRLGEVLQIPESARLDIDNERPVDLPGEPKAEGHWSRALKAAQEADRLRGEAKR